MTQVKIMSTTDVHAYVDKGFASLKDASQKEQPDLIVDNGDYFIGSTVGSYSYVTDSINPMVNLANETGYDVMIPGNHDLDFGLDYLLELVEGLEADYICSNLHYPSGELVFEPYVVKTTKSGVRVGVIGLMTKALSRLQRPWLIGEVIASCPIKALEKHQEELIDKTDLVLVLYHGGATVSLANGERGFYPSDEDQAYEITQIGGFNGLIYGHQHFQKVDITENGIASVQPGKHGECYGLQVFELNGEEVYVKENHLVDLEPKEYNFPGRGDYEDWLEEDFSFDALEELFYDFAEGRPVVYYYPPDSRCSLAHLMDEPFPLRTYFINESELEKAFKSNYILLTLNESQMKGHFEVVATPGIFPDHLMSEQYLIPLFDLYCEWEKKGK